MKKYQLITILFALFLTYQLQAQYSRKLSTSKTVAKVPTGVKKHAHARHFDMVSVRNIEQLPVWRVQLRIHTCNQDKAGTDSKVYVRLTDRPNERFWLNQGGDDRKRNETEIYDVILTHPTTGAALINTVRDIDQLTIGINGDDRWCFDRIDLLINNPYDRKSTAANYRRYSIYDYSAQQTIAKKSGFRSEFTIQGRTLRSHRRWSLSGSTLNFPWVTSMTIQNIGLQREVMEEIIEASVGHEMGPGGSLKDRNWGRKRGRTHVGILHKSSHDDNEARLDLDIAPSRLMDAEIRFKLECGGGNLNAEVVNVNMSTSRVAKAFFPSLMKAIEFGLDKVVQKSLRPTGISTSYCLPPKFTDESHLVFVPARL